MLSPTRGLDAVSHERVISPLRSRDLNTPVWTAATSEKRRDLNAFTLFSTASKSEKRPRAAHYLSDEVWAVCLDYLTTATPRHGNISSVDAAIALSVLLDSLPVPPLRRLDTPFSPAPNPCAHPSFRGRGGTKLALNQVERELSFCMDILRLRHPASSLTTKLLITV